jgi:hypothetical protein
MSFDDLMNSRQWRPIRNCPGRFVLVDGGRSISLAEIIGPGVEVGEFQAAGAKDTVLVASLDRGGMISYKRADGSFLHTLNTEEGFARKLRQLQIAWPAEVRGPRTSG